MIPQFRNLQIPTDNLYKFMAIKGLILFVISLASLVTLTLKMDYDHNLLRTEVEAYKRGIRDAVIPNGGEVARGWLSENMRALCSNTSISFRDTTETLTTPIFPKPLMIDTKRLFSAHKLSTHSPSPLRTYFSGAVLAFTRDSCAWLQVFCSGISSFRGILTER